MTVTSDIAGCNEPGNRPALSLTAARQAWN